jgi:uncharacterized protein (TIGR02646 family)
MIFLNSETLSATSVEHLDRIQDEINQALAFSEKAKKADAKWSSKSSRTGKAAFKEIKDTLIRMCVGVEICVYCEQNEATDIEHIYPKKMYPEKAFVWGNYVLACSKCNSHHKSDNFKIFNPAGSTVEQDVKPPRGQYIQPANDDALFINQRLEDPMNYLELDLVNRQFIFVEKHPTGTREFKKAKYTKELLGLNTRAALIANRKNAAKFYVSRLEQFVKAKASGAFEELTAAINDDWGWIDQTQSFEEEKQRVMDSIKNDVVTYPHPTVWKEMIRQRSDLPKTDALLNGAPEALQW